MKAELIKTKNERKLEMKLKDAMNVKGYKLRTERKSERWRKLSERFMKDGVEANEVTDAAIFLIPEREASNRVEVTNEVSLREYNTSGATPETKITTTTTNDLEEGILLLEGNITEAAENGVTISLEYKKDQSHLNKNNSTPTRTPQEKSFNSQQMNKLLQSILPAAEFSKRVFELMQLLRNCLMWTLVVFINGTTVCQMLYLEAAKT